MRQIAELPLSHYPSQVGTIWRSREDEPETEEGEVAVRAFPPEDVAAYLRKMPTGRGEGGLHTNPRKTPHRTSSV